MRQKLYDYLADRPGGATSTELLHEIFVSGAIAPFPSQRDPELGVRLIHAALGADQHCFYDPKTDRWTLTLHAHLNRPLHDIQFVVLDLETTGLKPGKAAMTEIAAVRVGHGKIGEEFHTLLNPGRHVPAVVSRLTGITDTMLRDQPRIEEVFPQLQHFLGQAVIVAHNASFDLGFLNFDAQRLVSAPLRNSSVCTLKLARRLLSGIRSRSLDAVAAHLGVSYPTQHRALADARVTAEIFCIFLERLTQQGVTTLGQLLEFQQSARDGRRFECFVPRSTLANIPASPGVYRMLDAEGKLLYIGKAKNLYRRVNSYFTNSSGHSDKVLDLVRHARDVVYEQTGSELEASLREADLIRTLKPPYNRLSKHLPRVAFLKLSVRNAYPRLSVAAKPGSDRALYIGPFRNRDFAERAQRLLARLFGLRTCPGNLSPTPEASPCVSGQIGVCTAPCVGWVSREAYREHVQRFSATLNGEVPILRETLIGKRDRLAADLQYEGAARLQQDIELLDHILHLHQRFHWIVTRAKALLLLPSRQTGTAQAYLVLNGRLIENRAVSSLDDLEYLATLADEHFDTDHDVPLRPHEIDASVILSAWLRNPEQAQSAIFPISAPSTLGNQLDELQTALSDLQRIEGA